MVAMGIRKARAELDILLVEAEPGLPPDQGSAGRALAGLDRPVRLTRAGTAARGLELALAGGFHCILLDEALPDRNGFELLADLRRRLGPEPALVLLTGGDGVLAGVEALKRGADDYLPKATLTQRTLERMLRRLLARHAEPPPRPEAAPPEPQDLLTGLATLGRFQAELRHTLAAAQRQALPFTLLVLALEPLQALAGRHGQAAAEAVLAEAGHRLAASGRALDSFFRIGPERFAALLGPGSDDAGAVTRLRQLIQQPIPFAGQTLAAAVRIGAARFPADGRRPETLLKHAEAALLHPRPDPPAPPGP